MAFNPYKKMIQKMMKAGKVFIQRDDTDHYYVSDSCALVKVPTVYYRAYIQTVSGYFIELEPGEKAQYEGSITQKGIGADLKKIVELTSAENELRETPFLVEFKRIRKKSAMARLCQTNAHVTAIDEEYFAAALECAVGTPHQDGRISPVVWKDDDGDQLTLVLPMRLSDEYLDTLKEFAA
ncbi:MAG: hypothetical protein HP061_11930 [Christensenellaceae bacterium]|nr:hypothetical protein [Christensenellaceae bacterium]